MNICETSEHIKDLSIDAWGEGILRKKSALIEHYYKRTIFCCVLLLIEIILMIVSVLTLSDVLTRITSYSLLATALAQLFIYHAYAKGCDKIFEEQMEYFKNRFTTLKKLQRDILPIVTTEHSATALKPQ